MLDQSKLAKLEIQGVTAGNTLEELLALSSAIEGAIRILDARSKELQKQLDEYLRSQTKPKRIEFTDEPEEDDADILINKKNASEDTYTVKTASIDDTNGFLYEKIVVDDTASSLLGLSILDKSSELSERKDYKLAISLNISASIGIPYIIEEEITRDDGSINYIRKIEVEDLTRQNGPLTWTNNRIVIAENLNEYITLTINDLSQDLENGALVKSGDIVTTTNNIEYYMDSNLLLALQKLSDILNSGYDGFLKVNGSSLEVVQYATCDEDSTT